MTSDIIVHAHTNSDRARESIGESVGDEMVAVGGAITKGKLLSAGRVEGTKVVGRIVGERVGEPEGRDEGLSEGHNERY